MKILLDGYFDHNLGDDLMLTLARDALGAHDVFTDKSHAADVYLKVTGSGFLIHNRLGIAYRMRDMYREKRYAPLRAVLSCNISPFINKTAERTVLKHLAGYDFITVRDKFSYEYIRERLPQANCEIYPDMVFSLPESMIPDTACENLLGIAVHNSMDSKKTARVADGYIETTGNGVLLLCFDTGMENDRLAAENILGSARHRDKIEIILYENVPDMLSYMKRCKVILGARLHSVILAARMGICFVPMSYSDKTVNALAEAGYNGVVYSAETFDAEKVLKNVLSPVPYALDKKTIRLAGQHIIKFKEFIEQQG